MYQCIECHQPTMDPKFCLSCYQLLHWWAKEMHKPMNVILQGKVQ